MQIQLTRAILLPWLRFSEKLDHEFLHDFIFGNMFPKSHGYIAVPVASLFNFFSLH